MEVIVQEIREENDIQIKIDKKVCNQNISTGETDIIMSNHELNGPAIEKQMEIDNMNFERTVGQQVDHILVKEVRLGVNNELNVTNINTIKRYKELKYRIELVKYKRIIQNLGINRQYKMYYQIKQYTVQTKMMSKSNYQCQYIINKSCPHHEMCNSESPVKETQLDANENLADIAYKYRSKIKTIWYKSEVIKESECIIVFDTFD